jgi:hypothetical protein
MQWLIQYGKDDKVLSMNDYYNQQAKLLSYGQYLSYPVQIRGIELLIPQDSL